MNKRIQLNEKQLTQYIKRLTEEVEGEYYKISPEEYIELMRYGSYHGKAITKMKKFQGKPLWITGDLNLNDTPTDSLGNVGYIEGSLNISRTNVSSIEGVKVKGYVSDYNSPRERIREKQELNAKLGEQESLRDSDEWALEQGDETGEKAHALFDNLVNNGEIDPLSEDDKEKLIVLRRKLQDLEREYEELDDNDDRVNDVQEAIDETQSEIEELEENDIDDAGVEGFSESFIEDYLDVDAIVNMAEEDYDYQVRENPESYFSDDDYELTSEQEERIEQLESQIADFEQEQNELDTDREDYDELYEDFQNHIDALQEELDSIEVDTEPTEEMIENKVYELVRDVRRDPLDYLKDYGYNITEYIDEDALAQGLVDSDGWGVMNSYDGQYDSEDVNGIRYYIMRTN
jgi:hypothetical protein